MQSGSYPEDAPPEPISEDCLYLNVWAPAGSEVKKRPILVWIYGGGLMNGSASTPLYAGDQLARQGSTAPSMVTDRSAAATSTGFTNRA
jgi:para-nitrobenzyl esterase